jgi:hypothetical protein
MGDPGLVAGDHPVVAIAHRAGAQRAQVRAGVGFGEHRRGQDLARWRAAAAISAFCSSCRRTGSVRPRSRTACQGCRRRYSRATVPRTPRPSRPWTGPARRIPRGWSGRTRPSRPARSMISIGISSSFRCHSWAWGATRSSAKRRNWSRIISSSSSSPWRQRSRGHGCRASGDQAGAGRGRVAGGDSGDTGRWPARGSARPRSAGAISPWLIGMPPAIWARYSPKPICRISASISPKPGLGLQALGPALHLAQRFRHRWPARPAHARRCAAGRCRSLIYALMQLSGRSLAMRLEHRTRAEWSLGIDGRALRRGVGHLGAPADRLPAVDRYPQGRDDARAGRVFLMGAMVLRAPIWGLACSMRPASRSRWPSDRACGAGNAGAFGFATALIKRASAAGRRCFWC